MVVLVVGMVMGVSLLMANAKLLLPAGWSSVSVTRQLTVHGPFGAGPVGDGHGDLVASSTASASDCTAPSPHVMVTCGPGPTPAANTRVSEQATTSTRVLAAGNC